jgi:hypothetical protein
MLKPSSRNKHQLLILMILFLSVTCLKAQKFTLSGTLFNPDSTISTGFAKLIDQNFNTISQDQANSSGIYEFNNIPAGSYLIKATSLQPVMFGQPGFLHTYYGNTFYWKLAKKILLDTSDINTLDIIFIEKPQTMSGNHSITGTIREATFITRGPQDPLEDIDIGLYNSGGDIIDYAVTDTSGNFTLENLIPGLYSIIPDSTGIPVDTFSLYNLNIDSTNDSLVLNIILDSNNIYLDVMTGVTQIIKDNDLSIRLYPNPTKQQFSIELDNSESSTALINIYNIEGKPVTTERKIITGTTQTYQGLPSGIYLLEISTKYRKIQKKLIVH